MMKIEARGARVAAAAGLGVTLLLGTLPATAIAEGNALEAIAEPVSEDGTQKSDEGTGIVNQAEGENAGVVTVTAKGADGSETTTPFSTLEDAVNSAGAGATITLQGDVTLNGSVTISKKVHIVGNDHQINGQLVFNAGSDNSTVSGVHFLLNGQTILTSGWSGSVRISGGSNIEIKSNTFVLSSNAQEKSHKAMGVFIFPNQGVDINGTKIENNTFDIACGSGRTNIGIHLSNEINDDDHGISNTLISENKVVGSADAFVATFDKTDRNNIKNICIEHNEIGQGAESSGNLIWLWSGADGVSIENNSFNGSGTGKGIYLGGYNKATNGAIRIANNQFTIGTGVYQDNAVSQSLEIEDNGCSDQTQETAGLQARIGSKYYPTLASAVDKATNGDTITMLEDVVLDGGGKGDTEGLLTISDKEGIILDGNGKTITARDVNAVDSKGPSMINVVNGSGITVKNLRIDGAGQDAADMNDNTKHGLNVYGAQNVVVENVEIVNGNGYGVMANGSTVTVDGLTTSSNGWGGVNVDSKSGRTSLTVNKASISEENSIKIENSPTSGTASTNPEPVVAIRDGSFQYVTLGVGVSEDSYKGLTVSGGKFATGGSEVGGIVLDISKYLEQGLVVDGSGSVVTPLPPTPAPERFAVAVSPSEHGKISADPANAAEGKTVVLTVEPDRGYRLTDLSVTDADGNGVELTEDADGTWTFTMPGGGATVAASFGCDGGELCPSHAFTDVDSGQWYHDAIDWAVGNGVLHGTSATTMEPNGILTRAQLAAILYNIEGAAAGDTSVLGAYADTDGSAWYAGCLSWAVEKGLIKGWTGPDGTALIAPDAPVTREQAAAILMRWSEMRGEDVSARADLSEYPDAGSVSNWAEGVMSWAVGAGVINGVDQEDGSRELQPLGTASRAQAAGLMMNLCAGSAE